MIELFFDLLSEFATAAVAESAMEIVVNDGPPARFCAFDPATGQTFGAFVPTGETVFVNRSFRLIVEPIDVTRLRPLCCVAREWNIQ